MAAPDDVSPVIADSNAYSPKQEVRAFARSRTHISESYDGVVPFTSGSSFETDAGRSRILPHKVALFSIARLLSDVLLRISDAARSQSQCVDLRDAEEYFEDEVKARGENDDLDAETVSDLEDHPWQKYFVHKQENTSKNCWTRVMDVPQSQRQVMRKIGITPTKNSQLRNFLRDIKRDASTSQEKKDGAKCNETLSDLLSDVRVEWSYYDIFDRQDLRKGDPLARGVVSGFSALALFSKGILQLIVVLSIWHSTFVFSFRNVLEVDPDFGPHTTIYKILEWINVAFDLVYFLVGVLLRLRTTLINVHACEETTDPGCIAAAVTAEFSFWADIATVLLKPVQGLVARKTGNHATSLGLGCFKLLRAWRLLPERDPIEKPDAWLLRMGRLVVLLLLVGHVWGCIWFVLIDESTDIQRHPLISDCMHACAFRDSRWPVALYYAYAWRIGMYIVLGADWVGMSGVENFTTVVTAPLGVLISALVFSQVIVMMQQGGAIESDYTQHVIEVKQALATLDLPCYLQLRILAFYAYQQLHRPGHIETSLKHDLSDQLRVEVQLALYYGLVRNATLFRILPPRQIRAVVTELKDRVFLPGDYVYRARDRPHEMFFIVKGACSVLAQDLQTRHQVLGVGESFGEVPLLIGMPHSAYIRADTYCVLAVLGKAHFEQLVKNYPKMAENLVKHMRPTEREHMKERRFSVLAARRRSVAHLHARRMSGMVHGKDGRRGSANISQKPRASALPLMDANDALLSEASRTPLKEVDLADSAVTRKGSYRKRVASAEGAKARMSGRRRSDGVGARRSSSAGAAVQRKTRSASFDNAPKLVSPSATSLREATSGDHKREFGSATANHPHCPEPVSAVVASLPPPPGSPCSPPSGADGEGEAGSARTPGGSSAVTADVRLTSAPASDWQAFGPRLELVSSNMVATTSAAADVAAGPPRRLPWTSQGQADVAAGPTPPSTGRVESTASEVPDRARGATQTQSSLRAVGSSTGSHARASANIDDAGTCTANGKVAPCGAPAFGVPRRPMDPAEVGLWMLVHMAETVSQTSKALKTLSDGLLGSEVELRQLATTVYDMRQSLKSSMAEEEENYDLNAFEEEEHITATDVMQAAQRTLEQARALVSHAEEAVAHFDEHVDTDEAIMRAVNVVESNND